MSTSSFLAWKSTHDFALEHDVVAFQLPKMDEALSATKVCMPSRYTEWKNKLVMF
jgi:hypothetical protein